MSEVCECVGYTIRTDYGTGIEHDVDPSSCPIHGGISWPDNPVDDDGGRVLLGIDFPDALTPTTTADPERAALAEGSDT